MPKQEKGKPFPWQINKAEAERLQKIEKEYKELRNKQFLEPFIKAFGHNLLVLLANTPYEDWSKQAKDTMTYMKHTHMWDDSIKSYLEHLPKK